MCSPSRHRGGVHIKHKGEKGVLGLSSLYRYYHNPKKKAKQTAQVSQNTQNPAPPSSSKKVLSCQGKKAEVTKDRPLLCHQKIHHLHPS